MISDFKSKINIKEEVYRAGAIKRNMLKQAKRRNGEDPSSDEETDPNEIEQVEDVIKNKVKDEGVKDFDSALEENAKVKFTYQNLV